MKQHPILYTADMVQAWFAGTKTQTRRLADGKNGKPSYWTKVQSGDVLWGRETWQAHYAYDLLSPKEIPSNQKPYIQFPATYDGWESKKRPSIHMPRWASRITQKIVNVRIERLQDISEADAIAEGIFEGPPCPVTGEKRWSNYNSNARSNFTRDASTSFCTLWESVYGEGEWECDPEVVVIEFERYKA